MNIDEIRAYSGYRVAVAVRDGHVYPGVLHVNFENCVRILQPIPPQFSVLDPEDVLTVEHRDDLGWPVSNASPEQTEAAAELLRPYLERRARLEYDDRSQIGVISLSAEHGWVLLPGTVADRPQGVVIALADLRRVFPN